jgi:hypothetical protein
MKWFSLIFLGVGIILLAIGAFFMLKEQSFLVRAVSTSGTVTTFAYTSRGSSCPIIAFTTQSGEQAHYRSYVCSNPPAYQAGQKVQIYYDPNDPSDAQMAGGWGQYTVTIILVLIGLPFSLIGVWLFFMLRR